GRGTACGAPRVRVVPQRADLPPPAALRGLGGMRARALPPRRRDDRGLPRRRRRTPARLRPDARNRRRARDGARPRRPAAPDRLPPFAPVLPDPRRRLGLAEVGLPDLLVGPGLLGVVGERDAAGLEDLAALGALQRHERVLLDEQDRRALLVDLLDDLEDLLDEDRREPHG